ncbi:MAG: HEPN domain-containing protein, partial [Archaeoglobaceae archaeon]|nr:HEPN domain-containing protein [Archaeoglobaceae archaeon]MDW8128817.1 HEPN domain-containing protein [Archaeoglobaceae archaeon]
KEEFERWMKQAEQTLKSSERDKNAKDYSWACFKAHQAAEFAIKGLLYGLGIMTYGHSLKRLIDLLSQKIEIPKGILRSATEEALNSAKMILEFVKGVADASIREGN